MKYLRICFFLIFLSFCNNILANEQEEVDKLINLPIDILKKMDERDILIVYFGYEDLNEYLLSIGKQPVFCQPKNFNPLDIVKWVKEDLVQPQHYLGKEKIDSRYPVAVHISAIMINKFPCKGKKS